MRNDSYGPIVVAAILVSALFADAAPVLAQPISETPATSFHAGLYGGLSFERDISPEYALRAAVRRDRRSWDASVASFSVRFDAPPSKGRIFEGLLGTAWHLRAGGVSPSIGPRAGVVLTTNRFGERSVAGIFGPQVGLEIDVGETVSVRGEGGGNLYVSGLGPGGPRGFLRIGIERRFR